MKSTVKLHALILSLTIMVIRSKAVEKCSCPSGSCQVDSCASDKSTVNITIAQLAQFSPRFVQVLPRTDDTKDADSVCNTFYKIDDHTFYLVEYIVLKNGSVGHSQYIMSDVPGSPGRFRFTGNQGSRYSYGTFNVVAELSPPCPTMYALHICNQIAGSMPRNFTTLSTTRGLPWPGQKCLSEFQSQVAALGYDTTTPDYLHPPQKYSPKCITLLNGARTINAHLLHPDFHEVMPDDTPANF